MTPHGSPTTEFISELRIHFGPFNPEGEAKVELKNLRMHDNQRITKYLVEFNRLAARVQWGTLHFDANSITDFRLRSRTKSQDLGNPTTFRNYEPCHRSSMPATGNADPRPLEKLRQTEPRPTRKGRMTRAKHGLTPRPRVWQTRRALGIRPPPPAPIRAIPIHPELRSRLPI